MRRVTVVLSFALACVALGRAFAGGSPEHLLSDEALIPGYPVAVVATVSSTSDAAGASNKNPPQVGLKIEQRLKGKVPDDVVALWRPMPHDVDWSGDGAKEAIEKWEKRECPPPKVGDTLILFGRFEEGVLWVSPRCRYPATDEKVAWVKKILQSKN